MTHSVCSAPQNVILLMNAMEWDFTDRCGGQQKNYKNFMKESLSSHKHDFGISAEVISAPCDGTGGAVKKACSQAKPRQVFE